jgi:hypothetical protein
MRYLLHNIYGDADHLIDTAPDDVTCVPFGWDEATETARNTLLSQLGVGGVSSLPSLLVEHDGRWVEIPAAGLSWDTLNVLPDVTD